MTLAPFPDRPFTTREAKVFGFTARQLGVAVQSGGLRRVVHGVYAPSSLPDTHESRVAAVALVVSPFSVVCDRTAAWLHGIDAFGHADQELLPPVETCVLRGHQSSRVRGVDGRSRDLAPRDLMSMGGFAVTTPLRTALDLGCGQGRRRALGALDQFVRLHGVTREQMMRELPRYAGRRGVVQLRALLPLVDGRAESMRESWLRLELIDAGFPVPDLQVWVDDDGVPLFRLDIAYPLHRIAIEYDGFDFHRRTDEQKKRDDERRTWLRSHGWCVIVVDKRGLSGPLRDAWKQELATALRSRTKRLRWERTYA